MSETVKVRTTRGGIEYTGQINLATQVFHGPRGITIPDGEYKILKPRARRT